MLELALLGLNHRKEDDVDNLAALSREAWQKSVLDDIATQREVLSRFTIAAVLLGDPVAQVIRRELRRISSDVKVDQDDIARILEQEVIKRDTIEGPKADSAKKLIAKSSKRALRAVEKEEPDAQPPTQPAGA